jgi:hypothetical protein
MKESLATRRIYREDSRLEKTVWTRFRKRTTCAMSTDRHHVTTKQEVEKAMPAISRCASWLHETSLVTEIGHHQQSSRLLDAGYVSPVDTITDLTGADGGRSTDAGRVVNKRVRPVSRCPTNRSGATPMSSFVVSGPRDGAQPSVKRPDARCRDQKKREKRTSTWRK